MGRVRGWIPDSAVEAKKPVKVTVTTQDLNNWHESWGRGGSRTLPVEAALERATGLKCWSVTDTVEIIEYEEYRREPTRTVRKLPESAALCNHRCLDGTYDLLEVPFTFEVDLPYAGGNV